MCKNKDKFKGLKDVIHLLDNGDVVIYSYVPYQNEPNKVIVNLYEVNNTGYLFSVKITFYDLRMLNKIYKNFYSCYQVDDFFPF